MQQYSIVDLGKELEKYGLRVGENPAFGSGKVGKHAPKSHHYFGEAIDVTDWREGDWQGRTKGLGQRAKQLGLFTEALGPGDSGHDTHVHLALRNTAQLTPQQVEWLATGRYKNQQGVSIDTMPGVQTSDSSADQQKLIETLLREKKKEETAQFLNNFLSQVAEGPKTKPAIDTGISEIILKQARMAPPPLMT